MTIYTDGNDERQTLDRMTRALWELTPAELSRLMVRAEITENMRVAACIRVEEADDIRHDNFDVPHYRGNIFREWERRNPVHGCEFRQPCSACGAFVAAGFGCDCEVPF